MPGMKLPYGGAAGNVSGPGWTEPEPDPKPVPAGWRDPNSLMQFKTTPVMKPTDRLKDKLLKLKQVKIFAFLKIWNVCVFYNAYVFHII